MLTRFICWFGTGHAAIGDDCGEEIVWQNRGQQRVHARLRALSILPSQLRRHLCQFLFPHHPFLNESF